jgi:integrase
MARVKYRKERGRDYAGCWFYKTADGDQVYYCSYRIDGKNVTAKFGAKSKGKTLKQCSLYRAELLLGTKQTRQKERSDQKKASSMQIEKLFERYCLDKKKITRQDHSLFRRWLLPYFKQKDMCQCNDREVGNYAIWLTEQKCQRKNAGQPLAAQSQKHCLALLRRVIRHCKKHMEDFKPPVEDYCLPQVNNTVTEDWSPAQLQQLLEVLNADVVQVKRKNGKLYPLTINRPVADIMLLIANTGMRKGEVLKLKWFDISFQRETILLRDPKGKKDLRIPMNSEAIKLLRRQPKTSEYIFPGVDGKQRLHIDGQTRILRDAAGLPKTFRPCHGLRHYYATELVSSGVAIHVGSKLLCHKSVLTTQRYFEARTKDMKDAVENLIIGFAK